MNTGKVQFKVGTGYEFFPKVVKVKRTTIITIKPLFEHTLFKDDSTYIISILPMEEAPKNKVISLKPTNGMLVFTHEFESEQEYSILVQENQAKEKTGSKFQIYALQDDLFMRKPYKGDFHIHSFRSDGKESPGFVAAASRMVGMDFMAVTDHHQYAPSLEAIKAFENVEMDLRIFPGEEIHPPENPIHMINFGGEFSINELFKQKEVYQTEINSIIDEVKEIVPSHRPYEYASCLWCFRKIREAKGISILCHPYWISKHVYNVPANILAKQLEIQPFDAFEVIGGYYLHEVESNLLQIARYYEESAKGRRLPIIGASDAHGCETGELFGWYYSIIFSSSSDLSSLQDSIKSFYSVAVEALPEQTPRAHGPFRLVKYAQFLLREVFPAHDLLCREEGIHMLRFLSGNSGSAHTLKVLKGQTTELYNNLWDI